MPTDTKDAPAKTPSKGFSLRSRLLGIPTEGTPEPSSPDTAEVTDANLQAENTSEHPNAAAAAAGDAATVVVPSASDDENDEGEEPPRVGMALAPKRSLLSFAFGLGDKKAKSDKTSIDEPDAPEPVMTPEAEPEPLAAEVEIEQAPDVVPEPEPIPAPVEAGEPKRGRLFSMLRSDRRAKPVEPEPLPVEPAEEAKASAVEEAAIPEPQQEERVPSPIEIEDVAHEPPPFVRFSTVTKTYDGVNLVVKGLDLDISKGEFLTLLGPSGSGKTTTLMMLAGFEQPTSGDILLNGVSLTEMPPHRRSSFSYTSLITVTRPGGNSTASSNTMLPGVTSLP